MLVFMPQAQGRKTRGGQETCYGCVWQISEREEAGGVSAASPICVSVSFRRTDRECGRPGHGARAGSIHRVNKPVYRLGTWWESPGAWAKQTPFRAGHGYSLDTMKARLAARTYKREFKIKNRTSMTNEEGLISGRAAGRQEGGRQRSAHSH
jgi:hypothetical protein